MSIFYDWTNSEIAAMKRATAKLRAQQTKEAEKPRLMGRNIIRMPSNLDYEINVTPTNKNDK